MSERLFSDLSLSRSECPKCGAIWINGNHMWATGAKGNEKDLASLVCNKLGNDQCLNSMRGDDTGDTWEKRLKDLDKFSEQKEGKWWDK